MSYSLQVDFAGQVGVFPGLARMVSTDDVATITTPGYISTESARVATLQAGDFVFVKCATGSFPYTVTISNGIITLATGEGSGDVIGPGGSDDNGLVLFNGTTGTLIKQSNLTGGVRVDGGVVSVFGLTPYAEIFLESVDAIAAQQALGFQGSGIAYQLAGYNITTGNASIFGLGTGISIDVDGNLQFSGSGSGDVIGPGIGGSTDKAIPRWSGVDGNLLNNSNVILGDGGEMTWSLSGSPTTQPFFLPQVVGGKSQFIYQADQQFIQGVTSVTLSGPAVARGTIGAVGTLSRYNANHVYLGSGSTLSPTQDQSSNVFNYAALSTALTVTLPLISGVTPGTFYDFILTNTGSSITFVATAPDTVSNVNGQTALTNQYSSCRAIAVQFGAANYWDLIIVDKISTGGGDVVGPVSSTNNAIVRFDGTTGDLIQDSSVTLTSTGTTTTFTGDIGVVTTTPTVIFNNNSGASETYITGDTAALVGTTLGGIAAPNINFAGDSSFNTPTDLSILGTLSQATWVPLPVTTDVTLGNTDSALQLNCTPGGTITITLPDSVTESVSSGFWFWAFNQDGSTINFAAQGSDTLLNVNGETSITTAGSSAYVVLGSGGEWVLNIFETQGAGSGDVVGPGSSVNHGPVVFNGTTGKVIQGATFGALPDTLYGDIDGSGALQQIGINPTTLAIEAGALTVTAATPRMDIIVKPTSVLWTTPSYQTGTVSLANGSNDLVGVGTLYGAENVESGDTLILFPTVGNPSAVIANIIVSTLHITLNTTFIGTGFTGGRYQFGPAGTVAATNGSGIITGTGTKFLTTAKAGNTFFVGSNQVSYTILYVLSDTILVLNTSYLQTTTSGVGYYTTASNMKIISNGFINDSYDVQTSIAGTLQPFNLTQSACAYKQIVMYGYPTPPTGMTLNYWVVNPTDGYTMIGVNTAYGPKLAPFFPGGSVPGPGTMTWVGSSTQINGENTFFTKTFKTGDFAVLYVASTNSYWCLRVVSISSDILLNVNITNPSSNFLIRVPYMRGQFSNIGSVNTSNVSAVVTGTGTKFLDPVIGFNPGDGIGFNNGQGVVLSIQSDTSLTLTGNAPITATTGAYFKLINTATIPLLGAYPADTIQFQEQVSGLFSPFEITSSEVFQQEVTLNAAGYYPANDAYVALWITKANVNANGLPVVSPLVPTDFSWGGNAQLDGLIIPFARNATTFNGTGTHFTSQLPVGRNIIIYPIPSDPTQVPYASPFITQVATVVNDTQFTVVAAGAAAIQNFGYCNYALVQQGGIISNTVGTVSVIGGGTDFTQLNRGDTIMYTAIVGGNATVQTAIVSTVNTVNSMTIQELPPNNFTQSPYARVSQYFTFDSPNSTGGDAIFATMKSQGPSARFVESCEAGDQEITVGLSGYQPTAGPVLNIWGPRPLS
jgi:hypothetical protein